VREICSAFADIGEVIKAGQELNGLIDRLTPITETDARKSRGHEQTGFDQLRGRQQRCVYFLFKDRLAGNGHTQSPVGFGRVSVLIFEDEADPCLGRSV
jgi:hypothetical protein